MMLATNLSILYYELRLSFVKRMLAGFSTSSAMRKYGMERETKKAGQMDGGVTRHFKIA
jgi:hypothetical protein